MSGPSQTLVGVALVADGDPDRGKGIAEACATRGLATRYAAHGAEALEAALADPPDVVIAAADLPVIAAPQLAGILRANPRTQGVRFIAIGGDPGRPAGGAAIDAAVPAPVDAEAVLRRIESLLAHARTARPGRRDDAAGSDLEGSLSQLSLADLLQLFHMNRKTGCIDLVRRGADGGEDRGVVTVSDGNVIDARCGAAGAEKALLRLLAWRSGSFRFRGTLRGGAARIHTPTRALLLEAMRQADEMSRLRAALPPLDAEIVVVRTPPASAPPLTREVLGLVRSGVRVGDVLDRSELPDYQVLRTLHALAERGTLALRAPSTAAAAAASETLFSDAQRGRLRDWASRRGAAGPVACDARVLVASSDPETTRRFGALLSGLPEVCLDRTLLDGRFSGSTLRRLARLGPANDVGIELLHLPAHPSSEPLWSLAAASALGLVALAGSVRGEGVRALLALQQALERRRRLPSCWAVLDPSPAALGAFARALGLRPETPVVRIGAANADEARLAVSGLLASLVP